ncbi:MAG: tetratricopeptide repeat protein, partial [Candidatus Acidiferrales bacterium]
MARSFSALVLGVAILFATPLSGAKHENWVEVRTANFIVVSNAGEKQARKTAIRFEQIRAVFRRSLAVASGHPSPLITILAVKDEDSMRELLPEYWVKGHSHPAGIFVENLDQYFALVQLDAPGTNPYNTIYHEYYHSLTLPYFPNLPLWVAEGLAEFWGNTDVSDSGTKMGEADPDLLEELKQNRLIPLDVLFKVDQSSPYYNEDHKTSIFYAESWALIHYLMIGDKASHRQMLITYLDALTHGASQDEAAAKAFGDLKKLQVALDSYVGNRAFYYLKSPPPPEIPPNDIQERELSDAEADAYRGGFCAVAGKTRTAKPLLEEAVKLDPKLALGYQYLGFAEYQDGQKAEALADFSRAIELNPQNALTRYLRAYLASTQAGAIGDDEQLEADLRAAIAASPNFAPPYGVLGVYLAVRGESLPEALSLANKAVVLEPGNATYRLDLAQVLARMNRYAEARTAANQAKESARSPLQKQQVEQFLAFLREAQNNRGNDLPAGDDEEANEDLRAPGAAETHEQPAAEAPPSGNLREATGLVTSLSCMNGLRVKLETAGGSLTLQLNAGTQLRIQMALKPTGPFNPCTALKGQRVKVEYEAKDANAKTGALQSVMVLGPAGSDADGAPELAGARRLGGGDTTRQETVTTSAEGTATQVTCAGSEMVVKLDAGEASFTLHARDASRVPVEQDVAFDSGDFQICSQLQGHSAKITFVVVDGKTYYG